MNNYKTFRVLSHEQLYLVWFKLAERFQKKRLKTDNPFLTPLDLLFLFVLLISKK